MKPPDVLNGTPAGAVEPMVSDLLRRTYGLLADCLDNGDTAVGAALLHTVEAALNLAEVREEAIADPASRCEKVREAYMCTRAAATAARFAVVAADDLRRVNRQAVIDAAEAAARKGAHHADR